MNDLVKCDLVDIFRAIAAAIETAKGRLSELDGVIGDADHGVTMSIGFSAVGDALGRLDRASTDPTSILNMAAKVFLNAVGASPGPLYATGLMRAGTVMKGRTIIDRDAIVDIIAAVAKGIQDRGKAERGDKTMVDVWVPAAEAAEAAKAAGKDLQGCLNDALAAAQAGAEATKFMVASKGRASRLGERAIGHEDPGAASALVIIGAIAQGLRS
jgi:dihydroxyacetone kinase-like protein